ncbi:MAG TPA: hypothetical protein VM536_02660 [Chloroflexia bacterium]|nr:hypothetical protein [Chloroflexia bacterium]
MVNNTMQTGNIADAGRGAAVRDDRIFPEIRVVGAIIVLVLIVASAILYLMPTRTGDFFAWTINPTMTPMLMGAGYLSGGWFFFRAVRATRWHHITWGFPAITAFVWFMGLATFLHYEKFNHTHVSFYAWLFLYVVTPFLVPALWFRNRVTDPGTPDPVDVVVPAQIRQISMIAGGVMLAIALFLFLVPDVAISIWPWKVTPLTARVVAGWFALPGVVGLVLSRDSRWSAWRIMIEAQMIALVLILVAVARAWDQFNPGYWATWGFVGGIALLLLAVVALYVTMQGRRGAARV